MGFVGDWVYTVGKPVLLWSNVLGEACIEQYPSAKISTRALHLALLCPDTHGQWIEIGATSFVGFRSIPADFMKSHLVFENGMCQLAWRHL